MLQSPRVLRLQDRVVGPHQVYEKFLYSSCFADSCSDRCDDFFHASRPLGSLCFGSSFCGDRDSIWLDFVFDPEAQNGSRRLTRDFDFMLCEICKKNEATCHVCTIVDDEMKSRDLCIECHEASSPEAREFSAAQKDAHCEYCGGQPCAGGTDFLALATGVQKLKFMCMPCSMEHNRFVQQESRALQEQAPGLSQQQQLALLRKINGNADKHMRQWVSERGSQ